MSEYTPTTEDPALEEVRAWYIDGRRVHNPFASDAVLVARFDAWLTEHYREVAAKAHADAVDWARSCSGESADVAADYLEEMAAIVSVPSTPEQPEGGDS